MMMGPCLLVLGCSCLLAAVPVLSRPLEVLGTPRDPAQAPGAEPTFCHGLDCPRYNVTAKTAAYEVRAYEASQWTVTHVTGIDYDAAVKKGFMALFHYIEGANAGGVKVPMAAPVAVRVVPGPGPDCKSDFYVAFFLPFAFWDKAPKPVDNTIFVYEAPAFNAYVASYPGFSSKDVMLANAEKLAKALEADGKTAPDQFYSLGYDSPFRVVGRHNEVMMMAGGGPGLLGAPQQLHASS